MCSAPRFDSVVTIDDANGVCPACGTATYNGDAIDTCSYGVCICDVCHHAPCTGDC